MSILSVGLAKGKIDVILSLLEDLGPIPEELQDKILRQRDIDILVVWAKKAARAESIEAFAKAIEDES